MKKLTILNQGFKIGFDLKQGVSDRRKRLTKK
jgi:hypothetical protein